MAAGTYVVTLTVTDHAGNFGQDTVTVVVRDTERPTVEAKTDIHIDQHETVNFDGSRSSDNVGVINWSWVFEYGGSPRTLYGPEPRFAFDEAGEFEVTLTVLDDARNNASVGFHVIVRDTTPPVAIAGPDVIVDMLFELALNGSGSTDNVGVVGWMWSFTYKGSPVSLAGKDQRYTFIQPGTYNITLTVADLEGNSNATVLRVKVRDTVKPTIITPGHLTSKKDAKVTLDGSASSDNVGITRWVWTFRDGGKDVTLEGMTARHAFQDTGDHKVTLTVYDADGNAASGTFTVTVKSGMPLLLAVLLFIVAVAIAGIILMRKAKPKE
jgi:PKD repeat protein